jgi:hypothetical protein
MHLRKLLFLPGLIVVIALLSACHFGFPPRIQTIQGTGTSSGTINIATGTGVVDGTWDYTHLGKGTTHTVDSSFTSSGSTFSLTGTATFTLADGEKFFTTVATSGNVTSTGSTSTSLNTITGGTGRFTDARGTITINDIGVSGPPIGSIITTNGTDTAQGSISY